MRISELKQKELINIHDGRRLGFILDIEFEPVSGIVEAIIIQKKQPFFNIKKSANEMVIPWNLVKRIGDDTMLLDFDEDFLPWC